jgi:undecaprenyl-diphosphatase
MVMETDETSDWRPIAAPVSTRDEPPTRDDPPPEARLFRAPQGGVADRLGHRMQSWNPIAAGAAATAIGYAALVAVMIAAGFVLTEWILPGAITRADGSVNRWLARGRTPLETDLSWVGSHLAESVTVIALGILVVVICCFRRKFLAAIFLGVAIAVEGAAYLATVQVIDRHRPRVVRLDDLGSGASYPSGHVAAAVAVYVGIALIVFAYTRNPWARGTAVFFAIFAPVAVAIARVYRGMHHPIDVASGALMGLGCIAVGLLVARVVGIVWDRRGEPRRVADRDERTVAA